MRILWRCRLRPARRWRGGRQLDSIAAKLGRQFPVVEALLRDAASYICAFAAFPTAHWKKV